MSDRDLVWGATPWDDLTREQLVEHLRRLYSAAQAAHGMVAQMAEQAQEIPCATRYWSLLGAGGRTLRKLREATDRARLGHSSEGLFRSFFRYADDLLFSPPIGMGWTVCELGHMTGQSGVSRVACAVCLIEGKPDQAIRPIRWEDLRRR